MRQRFSEYNHKLNSMFQLISAMADELNLLKNLENTQKTVAEKENDFLLNNKNTEDTNNELLKLVVSDEEYSDDSDDSDSDEESEENTDTVEYNNVVLEGSNNVLVINDDLEQVVVEEVTNDIKNATANDKDNIKLIEISANTEDNLNSEELDINKLTVKQLRDLVTKKGLSFEQSAKKKDLIKLLEENNN